MLKGHYAPQTPLTLHGAAGMAALPCSAGEGYLFFSGESRDAWLKRRWGARAWALSESGSAAEAAARLFAALHEMDAQGFTRIHAEAAPETGLGHAINDRLGRAQFRGAGNHDGG
jgi:L-threonylcarbamoyladenylate synthase